MRLILCKLQFELFSAIFVTVNNNNFICSSLSVNYFAAVALKTGLASMELTGKYNKGKKGGKCLSRWAVLFLAAFLISGFVSAQTTAVPNTDTLKMQAGRGKNSEARKQEQEQKQGNAELQSGQPGGPQAVKNKNQNVKQVKGARPDMSKARGARPQSIERPAGTRIPNGAGRPRGAGRPSGR